MHIIIKEINGFMPTTTITITENRIDVEENEITKTLKYDRYHIKKIMEMIVDITRGWKSKYINDKAIIDDEIYNIFIISNDIKEYYIKNKYPENFAKFLVLRNRLVREELKI